MSTEGNKSLQLEAGGDVGANGAPRRRCLIIAIVVALAVVAVVTVAVAVPLVLLAGGSHPPSPPSPPSPPPFPSPPPGPPPEEQPELGVDFDPAYPVYRRTDVPDEDFLARPCNDSPETPGSRLLAVPALPGQSPLEGLPAYSNAEVCLTCCAGGCQVYGRAVRGRDCVGHRAALPVNGSTVDAGSGQASDATADPWVPRPPEGDNPYRCNGWEPGAAALDNYDSASSSSSGFRSLESCFDCCGACAFDVAGLTVKGRDCLPLEEWIIIEVVEGRPLVEPATGKHIVAVLSPDVRHAWSSLPPAPTGSTAEPVDAVAARWERAAQGEHASVASFARHGLALMALGGAPPELLEAVAVAAADEVRHAVASLSVAAALRGPQQLPKAPGPLPLPPVEPPTLRGVLGDVLAEGCVEETVSAAMAVAAQRGAAADVGTPGPALSLAREAVDAIATEEAAHAGLAWRTLAWGLKEAEAVDEEGSREWARSLLSEAAARLQEELAHGPVAPDCVTVVPAYGLVAAPHELAAVRHAVLSRLVLPWLQRLAAGRVLPEAATAGGMREALAAALAHGCRAQPAVVLAAGRNTPLVAAGEHSGLAGQNAAHRLVLDGNMAETEL